MIGKMLGNRYEIIEKIGEGGMAKVYKAKCHLLNRYVAVKILKSEFVDNKEFIAKFNQESQSAAKLSHPNIVNIYDVGSENDINYIIMEYIDGSTLKKLIQSDGPFENQRIVNISSQIAMALIHAHDNRIIHRDIKPQNILITKDDRIKVADFGIARAMTDATTVNTASLMGSVHYSSPEQLKGSLMDERADIYSLGVIMYEMATGHLPYDGDAPVTVALKHMNEELIPPKLINPSLYDGLNSIIMKAMDKVAAYRYASAQALLSDLEKTTDSKTGFHPRYLGSEQTMILPNVKENGGRGKPKPPAKPPSRRSYILAIIGALILSIAFIAFVSYALLRNTFLHAEVTVPALTEMTFEEAKSLLLEKGLDYIIYEERFDRSVENGHIIAQDPAPEEIVKEGYAVKLTVSLGKIQTKIPNIMNLTQSEAFIALGNSNLSIGDIEYAFSDLPLNTVIGQSPEAGLLVDEITPIDIVLSQGQEIHSFIMPDLVDKSLQTAEGFLADLGLPIGSVTYEESETSAKDHVIRQSVAPGTEVRGNTSISLVVSSGSSAMEETIQKTFVIPLNFEKDEASVKVVMTQGEVRTVVFEKPMAKTDQSLSLELEGYGRALIEVFFDDVLAFSKEEIFE